MSDKDQLDWDKKKQDLLLNLGLTTNSDSDQTPTPTRFIRNCEEVGLFQDLQNVNPFDESFKNAFENPNLRLTTTSTDDTLHTPQIPEVPNPKPLDIDDDIKSPNGIKTVPIKRLLDPKKVTYGKQVRLWQKEANKASQSRCRKRKQLEIENMKEENAKLKLENANLASANMSLQRRVAELENELIQTRTNKKSIVRKVIPVVKQAPVVSPKHLAIAPKNPLLLPQQPVASTVIVLCQPLVPSEVVRLS